jgi:sulfate adenylyltransferase subunit 2
MTALVSHLKLLEAESIHIFREVVAEFERPVMLYSIGKDSSVLLRLAQKAFYPGPIPFPLLHVDTTYKFREMIQFRDEMARSVGARLIVHTNEEAIAEGTQPFKVGTQRCCGLLKTKSLLDALQAGDFDAAIGGARRDEERSRAKERIFSVRDPNGQWDPKRQRPELWTLLNAKLRPGESIRVFPLSNWTEIDVWNYIHAERSARSSSGARRSSSRSSPSWLRCRARSRSWSSAGCGRSGVRRAPARSSLTPTRYRRSSMSSSPRANPNGSSASSITTRTARWS